MEALENILKNNWMRNAEGIFECSEYDEANAKSRFSEEEQNGLFMTEDSSWWFKYRANIIKSMADSYFDPYNLIFDIGGGNGFTSSYMEKDGYHIVLVEPTYQACLNAQKRGIVNIVNGSIDDNSVHDESICQCMLLDVLEHIDEDEEFLHLLYKKMKERGRLLITVPAFSVLWSSEDDAARHYRRYCLRQLHSLAERVGFKIIYENYFFGFLFIPVLIIRVGLERLGILKRYENRNRDERKYIREKQFKEPHGMKGIILRIMENAEFKRMKNQKKIMFGSSLICVLEK